MENLETVKQRVEEAGQLVQQWQDLNEGASTDAWAARYNQDVAELIERVQFAEAIAAKLRQQQTEDADALLMLRDDHKEIHLDIQKYRRDLNIWEEGVTRLPDDVNYLLLEMAKRFAEAEDTIAAMRGFLEQIHERSLPSGLEEWHNKKALVESMGDMARAGLKPNGGEELRKTIRDVERLVTAFEEAPNGRHVSWHGKPLVYRIQEVVNHYTRTAAMALSREKAFRDDMLTWLRAMSINVDMVGNAGTHQEKAARLRGLSEVIESVIHKIQNWKVEFGYKWYDRDDIFKSDYPVREFVQRIHELERELKKHQLPERTNEGVSDAYEYTPEG